MRIHPWKTPLVILCLLISLIGCQKSKSSENSAPPTPTPAVTSAYEVLFSTHNTAYCGSSFISDLRINDGTSIGNVVVNNDAAYLYLTYNLATNWYMTSAQSFVGKKSQIPSTSNGNLDHNRFPGKKTLNVCDLTQKLSFKIPLAEVQTDNNGQCNTGSQFFIAMRSSVKKINPSGNCNAGQDQDAWAVPVLINPGNNGTWATAFYYCKQICNTSSSWCAFGQGYWFSKPDVVWCSQNVQFGGLVVTRGAGRALWPALTNLVKKAFFQASSVQLSMVCNNGNRPMPSSIINDYNLLATFLSRFDYAAIERGTIPTGTDIEAIKTAISNIGQWNCQNNCDLSKDDTACYNNE